MKRHIFLLIALCLIVGVASAFNYTIDGTGYNFGQQFTATAPSGTGILSDYQVRVNLSSLVAPSTATTLYTNASTRSDWNDIRFTDGTNLLPHWIENNTYTATNAVAWVRTPVSPAGTTIRVYYGNATKATSSIDGLNTFPYFDDFLGTAINTTQTTASSSGAGTTTVGSGVVLIHSTDTTGRSVYSVATFPQNTSFRNLVNFATGSGKYSVMSYGGLYVGSPSNYVGAGKAASATDARYYFVTASSSTTSGIDGTVSGTYDVYDIKRAVSTTYAYFYDNDEYYGGTGVHNPTGSYSVYTTSKYTSTATDTYSDWMFVRNSVNVEPSLSGFMDIPAGGSAPVSAFSGTPLSGHAPLSVSFTDESTNTPDSWNWSFGDGGINTSYQNPVYVYATAGSYDVNLSVGNAFGNSSLVKTDYITVLNSSEVYPAISSNVTTGAYPFAVAFTDNTATYNATIDSWYWQFGDGNTSALQNPEYTYLGAGTFLANLTVTNTSFWQTNTSSSITITSTALTSFTEVDMELEPVYTLTLHIVDAADNVAIPTSTLTSSTGETNTTINGVGVLTFPYSIGTVYITSEGYQSRAVSYLMDRDRDEMVQLTKSSDINNYAVTYPPKDIRFHVQTLAGKNIPTARVIATPYLTTLGSYTFVADLFGYDFDKVQLANLTLSGYTDSRGDITFAMMTDVQYELYTNKSGYAFHNFTMTPHDDNYIIYADQTGSLFVTNGTAPAASVTYVIRSKRLNATSAVINISYDDVAGATNAGIIRLHRNPVNGT